MRSLALAPGNSLTIIVVFLFLSLAMPPALAQPPKYEIHEWQAGKRTIVRLCELKTGCRVWRRSCPTLIGTYPDSGTFFWSSDHRAVAFYAGYQLVVWRAGRRVQTLDRQAETGFDYLEDITWSPNDRYLLIRTGGSGMGDINLGRMTCVSTNGWRTYSLGYTIGRPSWIGSHTVRFYGIVFMEPQGFVRAQWPSFWSVPRRHH